MYEDNPQAQSRCLAFFEARFGETEKSEGKVLKKGLEKVIILYTFVKFDYKLFVHDTLIFSNTKATS